MVPRNDEIPAAVTNPVPTTKWRISVLLNRIAGRCGVTNTLLAGDASCNFDVPDLADLTAFTRQVSAQS